MTASGVDLILAAVADIRGDLRRLEAVQDMILAEARRTNGRLTEIEAWRRTREAVEHERAKVAGAEKTSRRKWADRVVTLATGAVLALFGWYLQSRGVV